MKIEDSDGFFLNGKTLSMVRKVTLCEALAGFRSTIKHPRGASYTVDVKGPLHHNQILKLPGLGVDEGSELSVKVRISNEKIPLPPEAIEDLERVMLKHGLLPGRDVVTDTDES